MFLMIKQSKTYATFVSASVLQIDSHEWLSAVELTLNVLRATSGSANNTPEGHTGVENGKIDVAANTFCWFRAQPNFKPHLEKVTILPQIILITV
jgi:hypothetical protein